MVDDVPSITLAIETKLRRDGYECVVRHTAEEALETLRRERFDLVITDVRLPGMRGIELLRAVKEREPGLPVIVMTAYPEVTLAIEAMKLGADDYLLKPFEIGDLSFSVERALAKRRTLRADDDAPPER